MYDQIIVEGHLPVVAEAMCIYVRKDFTSEAVQAPFPRLASLVLSERMFTSKSKCVRSYSGDLAVRTEQIEVLVCSETLR